jgi:hypothetical protein
MVSLKPWLLYSQGIGGWVGSSTIADTVKKRNISCPFWESNLDSSVV